jgi:sec-independent protein translocase protein TatC
MSFLDHLEELRWHIVRSLIAILVFAVIAFLAKSIIFGIIILGPSRADFWTYRMFCHLGQMTGTDAFCIDDLPFIIQNRRMTAQFTLHLTSSFVIGLICAFPYTFWELWRFIGPGLYPNERNLTRGAVFFVSLLFLSGIMFGYFVVAPISINFLSHYQLDPSILNEIDISSYISTLIMIVLACGIMFQLPVVVFFLTKAGIVTPTFLKTYRKHAIVLMLALSAILTPPDIMSQMLMCVPLLFLYEISIMIARAVYRQEKEKLEEALR